MSGSRREAGFSLVEIMIVVAIVGILAAIAIPSFNNLMPRIKLGNNASNLINEIAGMRMQAIAKSKKFRITFDITSQSYRLSQSNVGGGFDTYSTIHPYGTRIVSVVIDSANPTKQYLELQGTGGTDVPLGSSATIVLQTPSGDQSKRILVQTTGRVLLQKLAGGGIWVTE